MFSNQSQNLGFTGQMQEEEQKNVSRRSRISGPLMICQAVHSTRCYDGSFSGASPHPA